jgi:hypothetical protein
MQGMSTKPTPKKYLPSFKAICTNFRLAGYKEPVLLSEFYKEASDPKKTFGKITLGAVLPPTIPIGGRLSTQREDYRFQAVCAVCGRSTDLKRCTDVEKPSTAVWNIKGRTGWFIN